MLGITTPNFIALNSMKKLILLLLPFIFFIPNNSQAQQRILLDQQKLQQKMMADAARIESQEDIAKLRTSTKNKQQ